MDDGRGSPPMPALIEFGDDNSRRAPMFPVSQTVLLHQATPPTGDPQPIPVWTSTSPTNGSAPSPARRSSSPPPLIPVPVEHPNSPQALYSYVPQPPYHNQPSSSSPVPFPWYHPSAATRAGENVIPGGLLSRLASSSMAGGSQAGPAGSVLTAYTHYLPPPDGSALQHPHAWSPYPRMFGQELILPPSVGYYSADFSASMAARSRATNESSRVWAPAQSGLPTEQQQQMYARMQQQQHEILVAQAYAAGRGRSTLPQHAVPGSQRNDPGALDPNGLAATPTGYLPPHVHPISIERSTTPTSVEPTLTASQSVPVSASAPSIQRTSSANLGHRVHLLSCAHCALPLTDRGMKAVLLLKPHISLYSTDACPVNVGPLFIPDGGGEAPRDGPERTCDCLTQGLGCLGCGSLLGYYIAIACSRCTNSVSKNQRSANGHRFVFHQNEVVSTERVYTPSEPGVVSSLFPTANYSLQHQHAIHPAFSSANNPSSVLDPGAHKRTTSGSSEVDPSGPGSRPSSAQSMVPQGRALQAGDVVFWRDLVKGGERVAPWFGPRETKGKKRRRGDEETFVVPIAAAGGRSVGR